ncbi:hypothetical protein SAMN02745704_01734 [Paucidesulfovibrio gracilis DSM 16080]|uniref:Nucleoside transporter/FeoB GTPase Gate domain-containing protein n=1 Tax=Paucidesulfovibrio gracilis DSM 16080 TaxID=1121449 RepID=A0A1T4X3K7_9BACT|nr:nucleoside recognition domain-containing protein [Paucidesulfovibrio gracilis]SKA84182.1 hypothetical protein SAMN02745704_01734 [Paucidesulfovibrio gracilis DSM 16080]
MLHRILRSIVEVFKQGTSASLTLFKVMIPIVFAVRLLQEFDLIRLLADPLGPVMRLVGLPPEMGLVWATALLNNIYSGMIVFLSLVENAPITEAQATVLGVMVLIAHGLPVELSIARKSGPRLFFQGLSRVGGALLLGWLLSQIYTNFDLLQGPANVLLQPEAGTGPVPWGPWILDQAVNLISIYGIILALVGIMRILEAVGVINLANRLLRPLLRIIGIGPKASAITVVGLTLGLSYGGGLIIHGARSGEIDRRDVFYSLTLMGVCHSLVEDTFLLVMLGGHLSGLLWGRLFYSLFFVALLVQLVRYLPGRFCDRFFWGPPESKGA